MDLRQIQCFLTAAKSLNFTNAALELNISQATLSRQISAMESEWNLLLFFRDNRNVRLTASGEYLYRELSSLYLNYRTVVDNAKKIFEGYNGQLTIGVLEEVTLQGVMQKCIHSYLHGHPDYMLDIKRRTFKEITDGLLDMTLDFGITLLFDISSQVALQYRILSRIINGVLISSNSPMAQKKTFDPWEFRNQTFLVISDTNASFPSQFIVDYCKKAGFYPKIQFVPDIETAMLYAEAGMGVAFSYSEGVSASNPDLTFIPLEDNESIPGSILVLTWNPLNTNPAIPVFQKTFDKYVKLKPV